MFLGDNFASNIILGGKHSPNKISFEAAQDWQHGLLQGLPSTNSAALPQQVSTRSLMAFFALTLIFLLLFARVFELQVLEGSNNYLLSEENRLRVKRVQPERGIIYDREKGVLAKNSPSFALGLDLTSLDSSQIPSLLETLNLSTAMPLGEAQRKVDFALKNGLQEVIVVRGLTRDKVLALETRPEPLTGVFIETAPARNYPAKEPFAHVLGFTGEVGEAELIEYASRQYQTGDLVGKTGLEKYYEESLHGLTGRSLLERDAKGKNLREVSNEPAQAGDDLYLTLDGRYQTVAFQALKREIEGKKSRGGAVVVMKADTGEVLALVSYPSFDNNIFTQVLLESEYQKLLEDPRLPFLDRTIAAVYPPASTFKLVTATAVLQEGIVTPQTQINEVQSISVGGSSFANWTLSWGVAPHGPLNLVQAIAQSSDIYFYEVGGGYGDQPGLGINKLSSWSRAFGFGTPTGIDLGGEVGGVVPDPAFKKRVKNEDWYLGDTYISAIGQGDSVATPLQVARMTAVVANGGNLLRPYLVERVVSAEGQLKQSNSPVVLSQVGDESTLSLVRQGMREAVDYGTAVELRDHPARVAAKTGTAETGDATRLHAWFTSFAPYEKPEIVVTVLVEGGGQGSQAALPIAKSVYDEFLRIKN